MEEILKEHFYSKEFNAQSLPKFRKFLKEKDIDVRFNVVKEFYDKQELVQRIKPFKERKKYNPIITLNHNKVLYIDSMFITDDLLAVMVAIDLFSKKAYAKVKKIKRPKGNDKGTSIKSTDTRNFLSQILEKDDYSEIRTDAGKEFLKQFKKFIDDSIVLTHTILQDSPKRLNSPIERFNRTFKNLYLKKKAIYGDKLPDRNYQKFIDEIIDSYNNTNHRTIKNTPNDVYNNVDGARQKTIDIYREMLNRATNNRDAILPVGTRVRLYNPPKNVFNKQGQHWSKRIYTVEATTYDKKLRRYKFNGKLYDRDYLNIIKNNEVQSFTVPRPRVNVVPRVPNNNDDEKKDDDDEPEPQPRQRRRRRAPDRLDL